MAKKTAEFDPDAPGWLTIKALLAVLGVSRKQLDEWRAALGHRHERRDESKGRSPVYVYAPEWLKAWAELRRSGGDAGDELDHAKRLKRLQADKAELDLLERRKELLSVDDAESLFAEKAEKVRRGVEMVLAEHPAAGRMLSDYLYGPNGQAKTKTKTKKRRSR